jgi:hypothetical protein
MQTVDAQLENWLHSRDLQSIAEIRGALHQSLPIHVDQLLLEPSVSFSVGVVGNQISVRVETRFQTVPPVYFSTST